MKSKAATITYRKGMVSLTMSRSGSLGLLFDQSGASSSLTLPKDKDGILRSPRHLARRRWASQQFDEDESVDPDQTRHGRLGTPDPPPAPEDVASSRLLGGYPGGILSSLRRKSFTAFPSPFSAIRRRRQEDQGTPLSEAQVDNSWSSDSSELDDELHVNEGSLSDGGRDEDEH